jgi:small subunit ribosomal protein S1
MSEKGGATVALPYGVEAFCPKSQLAKEDKTAANVDEQLDFKIIEFSRENKKIVASHSKTWQQEEEKEDKKSTSEEKAIRKLNDNLERTTLGDIDALANLKEEMTKNEQE